MKRLLSLLMCLMLLPAIAAAESGWIAAADLSSEEQELLELMMLDEDWGPYEFKAPEGANYITLTLLEMVDGQWTERCILDKELTPPPNNTQLTITATQTEDGWWDARVQQSKSQPDGRIYINAVDPPNTIALNIQQPKVDEIQSNSEAIILWKEERVNTFDMYCWQRTFLQPEADRRHQQQVEVRLDEPVVIELYVCYFEGPLTVPAISEFYTPEVFAEFDYAYAVTATFSAEPLPEAE